MRLAEHFISFATSLINNTGAGMLDYIYHMTFQLIKNHNFWAENVHILTSFTQHCNGRHHVMLRIDFIAWPYITPRRDVM